MDSPLFLGNAKPQDLLFRKTPLTMLQLGDTKVLTSGITILSYQVEHTHATTKS